MRDYTKPIIIKLGAVKGTWVQINCFEVYPDSRLVNRGAL